MRLRPSVLAIDDDPGLQAILKSVLPRFGLNIKVVATAEEFLATYDSLKPELILIDLQLGKTDGMDLIRQLRIERQCKATIIVVSGTMDSNLILGSLEAGADDFLRKPLERTLLATKLSRYVPTGELEEQSGGRQSISRNHARVKLTLETTILEVDELGLKLAMASFLPKGTVLRISEEFFQSLGIKSSGQLVTVIHHNLSAETGIGDCYAEFDDPSSEFLQSLRTWLGAG